MDEELRKSALEYHRLPRPGKISILATKQLTNQRDLALAYSPGVAVACEEIGRDPAEAVHLTSRANLIAVITNGTAVLGLGAIGPLAAKPVMEGKAVLFKKFAGIDCFDIEVDERDPDRLVEIIAALEQLQREAPAVGVRARAGGIGIEGAGGPRGQTERRASGRRSSKRGWRSRGGAADYTDIIFARI